jgi:O-antigen ligase
MMLIPAIAVVGAGAYLFAVSHWGALTAPLYDQTAFTGRTQIWPPLLAYAREHPIFGSGYGSFWNIGFGKGPIFQYSKGWVLHVIQGHNGYLDLLVSIGIPGLILVVLATIVVPIGRLLASQTVSRPAGALLLSMVLFCAGHNLTESSLFDRDAIVQTFLMFAVALIYKLTRTTKPAVPLRRQPLLQRTLAHD